MGSSPRGAITAAILGLPFAFAQFAHADVRPDIAALYRAEFRPSRHASHPRFAIAVRISCAETRQSALQLALSVWLPALQKTHHAEVVWTHPTYPSLDDIRGYTPTAAAWNRIEQNPYLAITGTPVEVVDQLSNLSSLYRADEMVLTTTCPDVDQRIRMHRLVAEDVYTATV